MKTLLPLVFVAGAVSLLGAVVLGTFGVLAEGAHRRRRLKGALVLFLVAVVSGAVFLPAALNSG